MPVGVKPEGPYSVAAAKYIDTRGEAIQYYRNKFALQSPHDLTCQGRPVIVEFEYDATHLYSEEPPLPTIPAGLEVIRTFAKRVERRQFSIERARNMDLVIKAIRKPSLTHRAQEMGRMANWVIYGFPQWPAGGYRMRVILRPSSAGKWACISAYCVKEKVFQGLRIAHERFPP
jgi:hypothetical protein